MFRVSDNIISKLGFTSEENFTAIANGVSGIEHYTNTLGLPEPFCASLIDREKIELEFARISDANNNYTFFEKICILSVHFALQRTSINPQSDEVIFVLSTTKGNVHLLDCTENKFNSEQKYLWKSAQLIAQFFKNSNEPIVVSNACISGICAQFYAKQALSCCKYKTAIVVGGEVLSKFIVSGFQSFKALSPETCKPFDINRNGLNLGEAAATIIYQQNKPSQSNSIEVLACAIRNDANHISGPSRTGEGLFNAIGKVINNIEIDDIAFICAHGTATPYNDEMESIAISRANLQHIPTLSLKAYFGHTLGAAGILESIIGFQSLLNNTIIKSMGYSELGVSQPLCINTSNTHTSKSMFLKLLSGFGGSNAAIVFKQNNSQV